MPVQFFGQYLLQQKLVTPGQLLRAVDYQSSKNLMVGELAVQRGFMSQTDADRVNALQASKDMLFGVAAVELNLLSPEQVDELLTIQRNSHVFLGDAIVQCGILDNATVAKALAAFKEDQRAYQDVSAMIVPKNVPQPEMHAVSLDMTQKLILRSWGVQNKIGTQSIRDGAMPLYDYSAEIRFSGHYSARYIISAPEQVVRAAAKKLLQEDNPDADTCADLNAEFANVVCGNIMAILAKQGRVCEFGPPTRLHHEVRLSMGRALEVQLVTPMGDMKLILTFA